MAINRSNIIESLNAKYTNLPCRKVDCAVKQIFIAISQALINSRKIELRNFGVFSLRFHKNRVARNPKTGEVVKLNSRYAVHFKPGKELNARINQDNQDY